MSTGGETARAVLQAFGADGLRLVGEIEPGVPLSVTEGAADLPVVTKAGAFGRPTPSSTAAPSCVAGSHASRPYPEQPGMTRPVVAITMGDAAGVGPEIIMKSLAHADLYERCRPLVIGDAARLEAAGKIVGSSWRCAPQRDRRGALHARRRRLHRSEADPGRPALGQAVAGGGRRGVPVHRVATELAVDGKVGAICTAPLNKEALHAGGHNYPGHTEMLAALTGTPEVSMMLTAPKLRVIHVTTHIGLMDAIRKIEPGLVERTIARGHGVLAKAGLPRQKIGVCAINPHAGENGLFGQGEEAEKIAPAIEACRARGWDVEGPLPADTLFFRAGRGDFDMVVAMYHDQGHGPVKVLGLEAGREHHRRPAGDPHLRRPRHRVRHRRHRPGRRAQPAGGLRQAIALAPVQALGPFGDPHGG